MMKTLISFLMLFCTLKNREECYKFFEDLCTVPELKAMSQRIAVAKMLSERHGVQRHRR